MWGMASSCVAVACRAADAESTTRVPVTNDRYRVALADNINRIEVALAREARQRDEEVRQATEEAALEAALSTTIEERLSKVEAVLTRFGLLP